MLLDNYSVGLLLFAVSMVATPGPANMILLNAGSKFGFKKVIPIGVSYTHLTLPTKRIV